MRGPIPITLAGLLAVAAWSGPARADGEEPGHRSAIEHPSRSRHQVWRGWRSPPRFRSVGHGLAYGAGLTPPPPPVEIAEAGGPILVELREPYLPRGVVYNAPPEPAYGWPPRSAVLRVRY